MSRGQRLVSRAAVASVGLVVAASLGACTDGGSPTPPTSAAVSTPVAPTTTAVPTTSAMTDDEAAMEAVRRFYREFDAALKSRDTSKLRTTFTGGCRICKEDAATIDQALVSGRTFESAESELEDIVITSRPDAIRVLVRANLTSPRLVIKDAAGKVIEDNPRQSAPKDFIVVKSNNSWLIEGVAR